MDRVRAPQILFSRVGNACTNRASSRRRSIPRASAVLPSLSAALDPPTFRSSHPCCPPCLLTPRSVDRHRTRRWNEEFELSGTLSDFVSGPGLHLNVYDCDNPLRPEKDESLGELCTALGELRYSDVLEFTEALPTKGKLVFGVTWEPPEEEAEAASSVVSGDERVIIGHTSLILRSGVNKDSPEVSPGKLPAGTRVELHEIRETDEGFRAHVRSP